MGSWSKATDGTGLTIRSSRDRFAASCKFLQVSLAQGRKAARLNSGVRRYQMTSDWQPTQEQHDQIFAELGRCLYVFQSIEARLKLMLPHLIAPDQEESLASVDFSNWRIYLDSKTTLGPLIQKLKDHVSTSHPELIDAAWSQLVKHRNEVMHHFVEQPFARLDTESKFQEALAFLKHRRASAAHLLCMLQDLCLVFMRELAPDAAPEEVTTVH